MTHTLQDSDYKQLILIRGLPGSGKTTFANEYLAPKGYLLVEADMYFMVRGNYCFNPMYLKEAHAWCLDTTRIYLNQGFRVVVCNTFTRHWELTPYFSLGWPTTVLCAKGQFSRKVPDYAYNNMRDRFMPYEREIFINNTD